MNVQTSINIDDASYCKLSDASLRAGCSRSRMISSLLGYAERTGRCRGGAFGTVKYNRKPPGGVWRCLHVSVRPEECEFFSDLKKVMKLSVSCIVCWAIRELLDDMLDNVGNDTDNYRVNSYSAYSATLGNVFHLVLCWGIPPHLITDP